MLEFLSTVNSVGVASAAEGETTAPDNIAGVWEAFVDFLTAPDGWGWTIVYALAALALGIIVVRIVMLALKKILLKGTMDNTIANFVLTVARFVLWLLLFIIVASIIHIPLAPIITVLGSIALAVGLALKDSLTNLANGVLLIAQKPFSEGQYIVVDDVEGTVKSIGLLNTVLISSDNKKIIVPNSKITSSCIVNVSARPTRRIDWNFSTSYDSDVEKVKAIILEVLTKHEKVLDEPAPMVRMVKQDDSALVFLARGWVGSDDYWEVTWDINEKTFAALKSNGIDIPFPQMDVHINPDKGVRK